MKGEDTEKVIRYQTAKGRIISLSPQEYEEIKDRIELSGERLLLRHSGGETFPQRETPCGGIL